MPREENCTMTKKTEEKKNLDYIAKRLDQLMIILLARSGTTEKEVGKIMKLSDHTIAKLVSGKFNKIREGKK